MRQSTRKTLDAIAHTLADAFIMDAVYRPGSLEREAKPDYEKLKNKTDIEFFKMTFRKDARFIPHGLRIDGLDVTDRHWASIIKTPYQMNYLANEICNRLKRRMWSDPKFGREFRKAFSMKKKLTQMELEI